MEHAEHDYAGMRLTRARACARVCVRACAAYAYDPAFPGGLFRSTHFVAALAWFSALGGNPYAIVPPICRIVTEPVEHLQEHPGTTGTNTPIFGPVGTQIGTLTSETPERC